jgi:hypothetical protein
MPEWAAHNPANFWNAADERERANGSAYREIEVALPRELDQEQRRALVEDFVRQELGDRHAYQWAIHTPKAALEKGEQPHAHIMYSERLRDGIERDPEQYFKRYNAKNPEKGGAQKFSGGKNRHELKDELQATRERWAEIQNAHLARAGHDARVDHRSLKAQGIDRAPEKHLGGAGVRKLASADISAILERRAAEGERERAQRSVSSLIDLSGDLQAARVDRDRRQTEQLERDRAAAAERDRQQRAIKEMLDREKQQQAERERNRPAPALTIEQAWRMQSRWETALQAERSEYLKELTEQARLKAAATVAAFQAHIDAGKPLLFGRQKWEDRLQSFDTREHLDRLAWEELKDGRYPFLDKDKKAVQAAVERRVGEKNPELAKQMPEVTALVQAEAVRRQQAQLERSRQAREADQENKKEKGQDKGNSR